jgi:hypothetical protein
MSLLVLTKREKVNEMNNNAYEKFKTQAKEHTDCYRELGSAILGKNEIRKVLIAEEVFIFELYPDDNGFEFYPLNKSKTITEIVDIAVPPPPPDRFKEHTQECAIRTYKERGKATPYFMDCDCGENTIKATPTGEPEDGVQYSGTL